ncbi:MAG: hypothetical protein R3342_01960 [Lutibacter sp.]|uniref:hypothetical protein n=1 Tax=Lutibacter sp. TaxID=1925666 RepID=UPI00299D123E|nr:hypothetical protein [Lutibacter sp.]MDX1828288.1 hypothetical protein [Lutibacter sp.]
MLQTVQKNTSTFFENAIIRYDIPKQRLNSLIKLSEFIADQLKNQSFVNLNFIDEDNSKISQLLQVWSSFAIHYFKLKNIQSYSGGISVSSVHKNTIKSLQKIGFKFQLVDFSHQNSSYLINSNNFTGTGLIFSKSVYDPTNKSPFIAIIVSENQNTISPYITDTAKLFHLEYPNPNSFDTNLFKIERYTALNLQIAAEIHFLFKWMLL